MPPGGSFIWFGCAPPAGKLRVAKIGDKYETVNDVSVLDWQRDQPILRHLQVGDLFAATMLKLIVPPDAQVLVDGIKGPMIVLDRERPRHEPGRRLRLAPEQLAAAPRQLPAVQSITRCSSWPWGRTWPSAPASSRATRRGCRTRPSTRPGAGREVDPPDRPHAHGRRARAADRRLRPAGPEQGRRLPDRAARAGVRAGGRQPAGREREQPDAGRHAARRRDDGVGRRDGNELPAENPPGTVVVARRLRGRAAAADDEWFVYTRRVHL